MMQRPIANSLSKCDMCSKLVTNMWYYLFYSHRACVWKWIGRSRTAPLTITLNKPPPNNFASHYSNFRLCFRVLSSQRKSASFNGHSNDPFEVEVEITTGPFGASHATNSRWKDESYLLASWDSEKEIESCYTTEERKTTFKSQEIPRGTSKKFKIKIYVMKV